jgi:hypothetical protein
MQPHHFFDPVVIAQHLKDLKPEASPLWGILTPQHMVEHLVLAMRFSNGKLTQDLILPEEKAARAKMRLLEPEWRMPQLFKAPFMPAEGLLPLEFSNIPEAMHALFSEIDEFYSFFAQNPDAKPFHAVFGPLNQEEWKVLHHKHIMHHLEQFHLIP